MSVALGNDSTDVSVVVPGGCMLHGQGAATSSFPLYFATGPSVRQKREAFNKVRVHSICRCPGTSVFNRVQLGYSVAFTVKDSGFDFDRLRCTFDGVLHTSRVCWVDAQAYDFRARLVREFVNFC